MNTKHIEQTHSEEFTSELFDIAYTDRAGDLVTSSLSKPYAEASGTEEVKGDFTSYITELPATLKVLIRRLFSAPAKVFGGKSMSQMFGGVKEAYDWLKERVKGSDGIPKKELSAVEDAAHLAENLRVLEGRDIVSGLTLTKTETGEDGTENVLQFPCPEGLSLVRLLCSALPSQFTEIIDTNHGWTMTKALSTFPNAEKILLGCSEIVRKYNANDALYSFSKCKSLRAPLLKTISNTTDSGHPSYTPIFNGSPLEEVDLSELQSYTGRLFVGGSLPEELNLPKLTNAGTCIAQGCAGVKRIIAENVTTCTGYSYHPNLINGCPDLEYAYIPNLSAYTVYGDGDGAGSLQDMPKLSHLVIGKAPFTKTSTIVRFALDGCPNLVLLDIRGGLNQNIYLDHWSPTTALAERLPEFLYNFQTYIADRVADRTGQSALTITLSSAVYAALEAQEGQTILATLTSKNWTVASA